MISLKTAVRLFAFCVVGMNLDMDWSRGHLELNVFKTDNFIGSVLKEASSNYDSCMIVCSLLCKQKS